MSSIQKLSVLGIKPDKITPKNNRSYLDTGKLCNYKCEFCYYKDKLDDNSQSFEYLMKYEGMNVYPAYPLPIIMPMPDIKQNIFGDFNDILFNSNEKMVFINTVYIPI